MKIRESFSKPAVRLIAAPALAALVFLAAAAPAFAADPKAYSAAELKLMSIFLSNFTEIGFMEFETKEQADDSADLIRFGVWHNYTNNFKSRLGQCPVKDCEWGSLTLEGRHVAESVKKYFDLDLKLVSVTESDPPYYYDGKRYHFEGADGESIYYARVTEARQEASGQVRMIGELYNADDHSDKPGKFEALAKPHQYGGKDTWALLSIKTEYYE